MRGADLRGVSDFWRQNPVWAQRAAQSIEKHFALLETNPAIGRPIPERPDQRELVIGFGNSGYVALYRWNAEADTIYILAFRHQREAGY